jgi:hypothetical protein
MSSQGRLVITVEHPVQHHLPLVATFIRHITRWSMKVMVEMLAEEISGGSVGGGGGTLTSA